MSEGKIDRIDNNVLLRAPRARVWRALTDAEEFGRWFGVKLDGTFAPGARVKGTVTHKGYEHIPFEVTIERMEPERRLAWRWHPGAAEPNFDYSAEPPTLVVFELEEVPGGTLLTVSETGFAQLPPGRREDAYRDNEEGWSWQMKSIDQHLQRAA